MIVLLTSQTQIIVEISEMFKFSKMRHFPRSLTNIFCFVSVSGGVRVLGQLGWLRLLCSPGLQQPGLGNTAGHTTNSGKGQNVTQTV